MRFYKKRLYKKVKAWRGKVYLAALWLLKMGAGLFGARDAYRALLVRLIEKTELFDAAYYLEHHADVKQTASSPLQHYVRYGSDMDYAPMALFDSIYYSLQVRQPIKRVNSLLHYAYVGQYRRISPSPWFDVKYYLAHNQDVDRAYLEPLRHYLRWGAFEGRSPSPQFDSAYYLSCHPELAERRINPLLHYLLYGRLQEHSPLPSATTVSSLSDAAAWLTLSPRAANQQARVDVIVPVYKGKTETLRCLYSVLTADCTVPFELIVINDASPDKALAEELQRLANAGLFTLQINVENRGFISAVNDGIGLHADRDVALLNADTEVYDGWLDRLQHAAMPEKIGTVTPLSNNASFCSYPRFLHNNPFPLELSYAELDTLTAQVNAGITVNTPTAINFCLYIKRACLQATGLFDELAFGRGYGEDHDFSYRAAQHGWQHLIACDIFVRHWGACSFQGEKNKREQAALALLTQRYPQYAKDKAEFVQSDVLHASRERLDWARLLRLRREKNILIISHQRGGGTERHIQEEVQRFLAEGYGVFFFRPFGKKATYATLSAAEALSFVNLTPLAIGQLDDLITTLKNLHITAIHLHSLVDFYADTAAQLSRLIGELGIPLDIKVHDYEVICPRLHLADEQGYYCGEPNTETCNQCLLKRGSDFAVTDIEMWRTNYGQLLTAADKIIVPDSDVAQRLSGYFPKLNFNILPHEILKPLPPRLPQLKNNEKLRIVVIGFLTHLKGFHVLQHCADYAKKNQLPLEFILMGYSKYDKKLDSVNVHVTGKYQEQDALQQLNQLQAHIVWLPSIWPETYSYTLSLALMAAYPVFAFNIGAIANRLSALNRIDGLMPLDIAYSPATITERFINYRKSVLIGENASDE